MKSAIKFSSVLVASIILFFAASAFADSNLDPKIIIKDPGCDGCTVINGNTFGFTLPTDQGPTFTGSLTFENESGGTWYSLFLTESAVPWFNVTCQADAFFNFCQSIASSHTNPNQTTIEFLNTLPNPGTGIPNGGVFTLDFEAVNGIAWPSGTSFDGTANATVVPEPGTVSMLLSELFLAIGMCMLAKRVSTSKAAAATFSLNTR